MLFVSQLRNLCLPQNCTELSPEWHLFVSFVSVSNITLSGFNTQIQINENGSNQPDLFLDPVSCLSTDLPELYRSMLEGPALAPGVLKKHQTARKKPQSAMFLCQKVSRILY